MAIETNTVINPPQTKSTHFSCGTCLPPRGVNQVARLGGFDPRARVGAARESKRARPSTADCTVGTALTFLNEPCPACGGSGFIEKLEIEDGIEWPTFYRCHCAQTDRMED